ncbi:uncharacterized protein BKA55DRAFT_547444 [Fusarium redolens]|uniref:Uncharacterized protein n=1 Tax=Fusarium redolens TaxID=48865 RepID=A0A9P9JPI9_FUSRE|nr:uncharacterized protein BKA55DRAFT_547444 [Fusarium redolens]KAH7202882.1 hypothetical protein BKA55DRAFT_547444 [Fusarium redolens]
MPGNQVLTIKKRKKSQIAVRKLVNKYGIAPLVFTSIDAARRRFPDLFPEEQASPRPGEWQETATEHPPRESEPLDVDAPEEAVAEEDPWIREPKPGHDLPDEPGVAAKDDEPTNDPEPEVTEGYYVDVRDAEKPCDEDFPQLHHSDDGDDSVCDKSLEDAAKSTNLEEEPFIIEADPAEETKSAEVVLPFWVMRLSEAFSSGHCSKLARTAPTSVSSSVAWDDA